ncbi:hypothetical protein H6P81_011787 [Aristolochia fimbriata]|uniref:Uncharacterized protein n=1 Tax=Aristolochia fimbriata TaxID=158543 RepID=A0AAV7EBN2_ARIFI|nr:hypothetical protein H6P81_011787 [Aristolochia fimbriata]
MSRRRLEEKSGHVNTLEGGRETSFPSPAFGLLGIFFFSSSLQSSCDILSIRDGCVPLHLFLSSSFKAALGTILKSNIYED